MSNLIQRIPRGLLAMFGSRGTGMNPNELLQTVQPIVDVEGMLSQSLLQLEFDRTDLIANANTLFGTISVPAGEVWRILLIGYTAFNFSVAGAISHAGLRVFVPGAATSAMFGRPQKFTATGVNDQFDQGELFPQPLYLPSGSIIEGRQLEAVGGTISTTLQVLFHRLEG